MPGLLIALGVLGASVVSRLAAERVRQDRCMASCMQCPELTEAKCQELCR